VFPQPSCALPCTTMCGPSMNDARSLPGVPLTVA
jgi:hypothetical protein